MLTYSTYVGGIDQDEFPVNIATDSAGNGFVLWRLGRTSSIKIRIVKFGPYGTGGYITEFGPYQNINYSNIDVRDLAVDASGNAVVVGFRQGPESEFKFPVKNAIQSSPRGDSDALVFKLDPQGSLVFSTLLGGSQGDAAAAVAMGSDGSSYIRGNTSSADFPLQNPLQSSGGSFLTKISSDGTTILYSTRLDTGTQLDVARQFLRLDDAQNMYVAQTDYDPACLYANPGGNDTSSRACYAISVLKLNAAGSAFLYRWRYGSAQEDAF